MLASIDVHAVSGHDRVTVLRALQRMAAFYEAQAMAAMTAIVDSHQEELGHDGTFAEEGAAAEIRVALTLTLRAADSDLSLALDLIRRLPAVWHSLGGGQIDVRRARVMVQATDHHPEETARQVFAAVGEEASSLTTGQLYARIRRLSLELNAADATERYKRTVAERRVMAEPTIDGTVHLLGLDLPADRVAEASSRIDAMARSLRGRGEGRSGPLWWNRGRVS